MICSKEFMTYINGLMVSRGGFSDFATAFDKIGKKYGIAKLVYRSFFLTNVYFSEEEKDGHIAYEQKDMVPADAPCYVKNIVSGEKETIRVEVYRAAGECNFSEEEKQDIDVVLKVMSFHVAGWQMNNIIRNLKYYDGLTGLVNAGGFLLYFDSLVVKKQHTKYNAYYFNLSRFSLVNKRFGSAETDKIIVRYTNAVQDFLLPGEMLGRLGGDNFTALILKERTEKFLQLLSGLTTYGMVGDIKLPVRVSAIAGVLEIDDSITSNERVLNDSAMAMNVAKHVLKKPYVFASEQMREKEFMNKQIAACFKEALANREFEVYYQPKVSGKDCRVVGGEALSRWVRDGVIMQPLEFIPIIEQNEMICLLDFYVLEQVCKDIQSWCAKGLNVGRMSVNFSRKHLTDPELVDKITGILQKYDMDSRYIEIELTETVNDAEAGLMSNFIGQMKKHNIVISIDDFGTGYSSLNMLRSLSVDVLKIDKSFIGNLDDRNKIVLSNIIRMAQELCMEVVAEGVETKEQARYLREIGCHILQGFLFDKPIPKAKFEERMHEGEYSICL